MNVMVRRIDGAYRLVSETMQIIDSRSWKTANGAKRYAVRNGHTLSNAPVILGAALLTKTTGKCPYLLIVKDRTFPFHTKNAAIQYNRYRFMLPIVDYTEIN